MHEKPTSITSIPYTEFAWEKRDILTPSGLLVPKLAEGLGNYAGASSLAFCNLAWSEHVAMHAYAQATQ